MRAMNHYKLIQRCRPEGTHRIPELLEFLDDCKELLGISVFGSSEGTLVVDRFSVDDLTSILRASEKRAIAPSAGVDFDIHGSLRDADHVIRFEVHCGTRPGEVFVDFVNLDFGRDGPIPPKELLTRGVRILLPFEAYVAELNNEHLMDAYSRQRKIIGFSRPAVIRWLHYLDRELVASVGGLSHCVGAPVACVNETGEGVLIELTSDPFDSGNPGHLSRQRSAMDYFEIPG